MRTLFTRSALWQDRSFNLIWTGQTASIFGDRVTDIALPWLILTQTRAPFDAALVVAARYIPMIAFGLPVGMLADLLPRRRLLIGSDLLRAAALALVVILALGHHAASLWLLAGITFALGVGQLAFQTAYRAWLPEVVGDPLLGRSNAALEAADAASTVAGPAFGGYVIQALGPALALGADLLSYLVSATTLWGVTEASDEMNIQQARRQAALRAVRRDPRGQARRVWRYAAQGASAIWASDDQRFMKIIGAPLVLCAGTITVLLAILTETRLHLPAWQAGLVFASAGIGGLLGSAIAPRALELPWRQASTVTYICAAMGLLGLLCATFAPSQSAFALATLSNGVLDGAVSLSFVITGTQQTLITPSTVRGRVGAVSQMYSAAVRGLGLVLLGALAFGGNPGAAFALLALVFTAAAILLNRADTTDRARADDLVPVTSNQLMDRTDERVQFPSELDIGQTGQSDRRGQDNAEAQMQLRRPLDADDVRPAPLPWRRRVHRFLAGLQDIIDVEIRQREDEPDRQ